MLIPCRFRTLCFWLYSEPTELGGRLDSRVDDMISVSTIRFSMTVANATQQGLIDEVKCMRQLANNGALRSSDDAYPAKVDYTLGVYQAIGNASKVLVESYSLILHTRLQRILWLSG